MLADPRKLVRAAVASALGSSEDVELVAQAEDGLRTLDLARQERPDVILLRTDLPRYNGLQIAARICSSDPGCAIVIVDEDDDADRMIDALHAGARGYLTYAHGLEDVLVTARATQLGATVIPNLLLKELLYRASRRVDESQRDGKLLSPRQRQILTLRDAGKSVDEIAGELNIAKATVRTHLGRVRRRSRYAEDVAQ